MENEKTSKLYVILSQWPISTTLMEYLPAGDLLNLARSSSSLRAALHDWGPPRASEEGSAFSVRPSLSIGQHQTPYWRELKKKAPFLCCSPRHTKGSVPRPCKYCSRPICEACIVRSSMSKPNEGTFRNRFRYLCKCCWEKGRPTKRQRFPSSPNDDERRLHGWWSPETSHVEVCTCTLKNDGWICLDCKDTQNQEAADSGRTTCFGEACSAPLEGDKDRRKVCLWCHNPLPVLRVGAEPRHVWTQKMMAAKRTVEEGRRADLEEYNRNRLKQLRMSRRELRGDQAVDGDPDADVPQFVRHLDTVNYHRWLPRDVAPNGDAIYASKAGKFTYSPRFLLKFQFRCKGTAVSQEEFRRATSSRDHAFARTNLEKGDRKLRGISTHTARERQDDAWYDLKAHILQLYSGEGKSLLELQMIMREDYHFLATEEQYMSRLTGWGNGSREVGDKEALDTTPLPAAGDAVEPDLPVVSRPDEQALVSRGHPRNQSPPPAEEDYDLARDEVMIAHHAPEFDRPARSVARNGTAPRTATDIMSTAEMRGDPPSYLESLGL